MFSPSEVLAVKAISLALASISSTVARLEVGLPRGIEVGAAGAGPMQPVGDAFLDGRRGETAERVQGCRVQVGLERHQRKVVAHGGGKDGAGPGRLAGEHAMAGHGQGTGTGEELTTSENHGTSWNE